MPNMAIWCCCNTCIDHTACSDTLSVTFSGVDACLCQSGVKWEFDNPFNSNFTLNRVASGITGQSEWEGTAAGVLRRTTYSDGVNCQGTVDTQVTYDVDLRLTIDPDCFVVFRAFKFIGGFTQELFSASGTEIISSCSSFPSLNNSLSCGGLNRAENGSATIVEV